jgi:hypothetical protein
MTDSLAFFTDQMNRVNGRPKPDDRRDPKLEAMRAFCLVLLNTNEFVTID